MRKHLNSLITALSLCAGLALPVGVQAQRSPGHIKHVPPLQHTLGLLQSPLLQRAQTPRLSATVSKTIVSVPCPPDAIALTPAVSCGYLPLPLERKHPTEEKINIYFEVYPHTNAGPAESAIVPNPGGPGTTTSGLRGLWLSVFAPNLDAHDLLLVDDRGRGNSGALGVTVCQDLQHGTAPSWDQAVAQCAAQLGDDNSRYGTGDIALDVEAVRAALGYDKLDFYGGSYGGVDAIAYATRFGQHLRSLVLDSPDGPPALLPFSFVHYEAPSTSREVRVDCLRSPACSIDHPEPDEEWEELIKTIRHHPVDGMAYDLNGNLTSVHLDEAVLLVLAEIPAGGYVNTGEFLAAAVALEHGDPAPLLRLGAEGYVPLLVDYGDPTIFSWVATNATGDGDSQMPFEWSAPPQLRLEQFEEAVSDLPLDYFHPFSVAAATSLENGQAAERAAIYWEEATPPALVVPLGAEYPNVPTLVMGSDIEPVVPLELSTKVAALFPESTFVSIAGGTHESATGGNQCAQGLMLNFIETLKVGDTSCAAIPETIWPAVGRFPLFAEDARAAELDPDGLNEIGNAERKVVTVAVAAATDALQRFIIAPGTDGVGLRAGSFHADSGSTAWTITLTNCAFANDVTVNGTIVWVWASTFQADLTITGVGTAGGTLHVEGTFQAAGPVGKFKVTGMLGGKRVAVLVPEG